MMLQICRRPIEACLHPPDLNIFEINIPGIGKVRGERRVTLYHETYYAFENIPYGYKPVDSLRFKAPWVAERWKYCKNCRKPGKVPVQVDPLTSNVIGDEDCLNLNIYVKRIREVEKFPVMVFIPDGGFSINQTSDHQPDYFMFEDVVLVTINFRVGALGFLTMHDFELEVPGNTGLKDIILALKWVQKNCVHFNGNSRNICLFGCGSGAAAAHILSCSPRAKGLFQKVILQSGSMLCQWSFLPQSSIPYRLALVNGYTGPDNERHILAFLRLLPAEVLSNIKLLINQDFLQGILHPFAPTIECFDMEHSVIREPYNRMLEKAWGNRIPMIIGGASFEGLYLNKYKPLIVETAKGNLVSVAKQLLLPPELKRHPGPKGGKHACEEALQKTYKTIFKSKSLKEIYTNLLQFCSIRFFWHGIHRTVLFRHKFAMRHTYQYRFDFDSPEFNLQRHLDCSIEFLNGVDHGDDLYYLFKFWNSFKLGCDSSEYLKIRQMVKMWVSFALNSNPNPMKPKDRPACFEQDEDQWKSICDSDVFHAYNISYQSQFIRLPEEKKLKVWDSLYPIGLY